MVRFPFLQKYVTFATIKHKEACHFKLRMNKCFLQIREVEVKTSSHRTFFSAINMFLKFEGLEILIEEKHFSKKINSSL